MALTRPWTAPRRMPLWAWHLDAWIRGGRKGPRPSRAPKRPPAWFWPWRWYRLARAKRKGSWAWKRYKRWLRTHPDPEAQIRALRKAITDWGRWGAAHEPQIAYSQSMLRDDFLSMPRGHLPMTTDCSGFVTYCYWSAGAPDPSGLGYRWVGFTGTLLSNAYQHGHVYYDLSLARPGDSIVIGPGSGWHAVLVLEAGHDPLVVSHGNQAGPQIYRSSRDPRQPKRVCQILPT